MTDALGALRERVAQACRILGALGLADANSGHVSARVPGTDRILIRARGPGETGVRFTTAAQIIEVGFDGNAAPGADPALKSPIEVFIHTEVYRARPDVEAVVHVHPASIVLFTICDVPLLPVYGAFNPAGLMLALDGVPTYDRSILIKTPALGADLATVLGDRAVCMMRGHGVTAVAASIEAAATTVIQLNDLAEMNARARMLGTPRAISVEDQDEFRIEEHGSGASASARLAALWRFYATKAGEPAALA
jgi:ribulose-5-phosphate 4-epimerase/fuculose-1-phosphate aldolase